MKNQAKEAGGIRKVGEAIYEEYKDLTDREILGLWSSAPNSGRIIAGLIHLLREARGYPDPQLGLSSDPAPKGMLYAYFGSMKDAQLSGVLDVEALSDADAYARSSFGEYLVQINCYRRGSDPMGRSARVVWKKDGFDLQEARERARRQIDAEWEKNRSDAKAMLEARSDQG